MWTDIKAIYRSAGAFSRAFPLLFLIPVAVEMAQHVVELQAGMYTGEAGAAAAEGDALRLWFGFAKTLALLLPGYWLVRFVLLPDPRRAARVEWPAIGLYGVIFAFLAIQSWWSLFGPELFASADRSEGAGVALGIAKGVALQIVMLYLTAWTVAWALGNARIGPLRSVRIMHGSFWYALGLMVAGVLPLMILHYAAAIAAVVWAPAWFDWVLMAADSLVVGYLALTIAGSAAYAARRAALRREVELVPDARKEILHPSKIPLGSPAK